MHDSTESNKVILINDVTSRRNLDQNSVIYLTATKVAQYRPAAENSRKKEGVKKETANNTLTRKLHLQKKRCEYFQK